MFWDLVQKMIPGLTGVDRLSAVFTAAFGTLSDGRMWRSVAWIVVGFALVVIAILWLMGGILDRTAPDTSSLAGVAALAA